MAWARHGPRAAQVERIEVEPDAGELGAFEVRPTA
jgi:hypothetical protein